MFFPKKHGCLRYPATGKSFNTTSHFVLRILVPSGRCHFPDGDEGLDIHIAPPILLSHSFLFIGFVGKFLFGRREVNTRHCWWGCYDYYLDAMTHCWTNHRLQHLELDLAPPPERCQNLALKAEWSGNKSRAQTNREKFSSSLLRSQSGNPLSSICTLPQTDSNLSKQ